MNDVISRPLILKKKSRSSNYSGWNSEGNGFKDKLFRALYIFLLIFLDFVMFIYSINGKIMENGVINPAVAVIVGGIFAFSILLILLLSFSKDFQISVCALVTTFIIITFFYQFGLGDVDGIIFSWLFENVRWLSFIGDVSSPLVFGIMFGLLVLWLFKFSGIVLFTVFVLLFSSVIGIQKNEFLVKDDVSYKEIKSMPVQLANVSSRNIIYLMLPKFPSYQFLNIAKDEHFNELRDLLLGFYIANKFEVYPNAFVLKNDNISNVVDILNQVDYTLVNSMDRGVAEYDNHWNFVKDNLDILSLEKSALFNYAKKNGYRISSYVMPGLDFCLEKGFFVSDRCVVNGHKTVSLYNEDVSLENNVYAILGEWLLSTKIQSVLSLAQDFIRRSYLKNMKVLAENRNPSSENGADIFDYLANDYNRDGTGQLYTAYVDLPSDVFIYDEYCRLKPRRDWVSLKDNRLYGVSLNDKRQAYVEQAKCLIGRMQEYLDEIKRNPKSSVTDIYIQGISPLPELAGVVSDSYQRFVTNNLVNLAVRRGSDSKFLVNANVCLASDFTKTLLRYQDYCYSFDNMRWISSSEAVKLKQSLINKSVLRSGRLNVVLANYRVWLDLYKKNSPFYQAKMQQLAAQQEELRNVQNSRQLKAPIHSINNANVYVPEIVDNVGDKEDVQNLNKIHTEQKVIEQQIPSAEPMVMNDTEGTENDEPAEMESNTVENNNATEIEAVENEQKVVTDVETIDNTEDVMDDDFSDIFDADDKEQIVVEPDVEALAKVEEDVNELQNEVSTIEKEIQPVIEEEVKPVAEAIEKMEEDVNELQNEVSTIEEKIQPVIEEEVKPVAEAIEKMEEKVNELQNVPVIDEGENPVDISVESIVDNQNPFPVKLPSVSQVLPIDQHKTESRTTDSADIIKDDEISLEF